MPFSDYFPIYNKLTPKEQALLSQHARLHTFPKDTLIHNGSDDCLGLLLIQSGALRAFITSDEGREVTIYRLFERDLCLFSASCMMQSIQFDISITAEKDCEVWIIPADVYKKLMEKSAVLANYTNEVMATRFTDVMWLIEQVLWKGIDTRLAAFLVEETSLRTAKFSISPTKKSQAIWERPAKLLPECLNISKVKVLSPSPEERLKCWILIN